MERFEIPAQIVDRYKKLCALCEKYPMRIPLVEVAAFLGMKGDTLRDSIDGGRCPFGFANLSRNANNRSFCIDTLAFYIWETQRAPFREDK